jgi:hypothetical protein
MQTSDYINYISEHLDVLNPLEQSVFDELVEKVNGKLAFDDKLFYIVIVKHIYNDVRSRV